MKFALVSHVLPPSRSGQAMMLYRLLKDLQPGDYCLISQHDYQAALRSKDYTDKLPGRYYRYFNFAAIRSKRSASSEKARKEADELIGTVNKLFRRMGITGRTADQLRLRFAKWRELLGLLLVPPMTILGSWRIASIMRREGCEAVVACSGNLANIPAGYLASRLAAVPFYPYLFDFYSCAWLHPVTRFFGGLIERVVLRRAAAVIVPNEFLQEELRHRYRVEAIVIHNPCDISPAAAMSKGESSDDSPEFKIVFTGTIYRAHYDAFHRLLAAIKLLTHRDIKLHLYTSQLPRDLVDRGIEGPVVYHKHCPLADMPRIQRDADLLFLPLAFTTPFPELIRTSAPGKMGEYLAAGRPVLVHAPPDSFVTWYFRRHECGVVVDQNDPGKLSQAIEQLLIDPGFRQRLGIRARERANADFNISVAQAKFVKLMKLKLLPAGQARDVASVCDVR